MRYPELHYRWSWLLKSSPERLWPYVADTNRFNRDVGLPAVQPAGTGANARRRLRFRMFGVKLEWDEEPFEWLRPQRFSVRRFYRSGPIASLRATVTLEAQPEGGTQLVYESWVRPKTLVGLVSLPFSMGVRNRRAFEGAFRRYDEAAVAESSPSLRPAEVRFEPGGPSRLKALEQRLIDAGGDAHLLSKLVDFVSRADEMTLARIRPYAVADEWCEPRRPVLELFLWATREGLFDLSWDLLCPLCRGTKDSASRLVEVASGVHCDTCNIDLSSNLEGAIELTFRLNPAVRKTSSQAFCVAGPEVTPHVVAQQLLAPGETRELRPAMEAGRYRLRLLGMPGGEYLMAADDGVPSARFQAENDVSSGRTVAVGLQPALALENNTAAEHLFILERLAWADNAVTAAEVIRMQTFRDLFSGELLRPGEEISIGSLTVAFTDLRDSTRIYQEIGDATAFGRVLDHFAVLREEVTAQDGALIKTIGDAVMAVFPRPLAGITAMLNAQRRLDAVGNSSPQFKLKAGLHEGPCIAVTLNGRLDYFGSTVNLASRLERYSSGDDVIVSQSVRDDPEVSQFLLENERMIAEPFAAELKGFEGRDFRLWRVACAAPE